MRPAFKVPPGYAAKRAMEPREEAADLESAGRDPEGREVLLEAAAAAAWAGMAEAARKDGVTLLAVSGFRSIRRQEELIARKLAAGEGVEAVLRVMAAPGYSEHHTGRAVDIATPGEPALTEDFERTEAFRWLGRRARNHGFTMSYPRGNPHGMAYEPWHWFHGRR
ncbi:MAG TPA: M15 family metallopeptidase [Opitutaceae bacterium]|jgi:D-alanyl-D-alanine carboxypeptidase